MAEMKLSGVDLFKDRRSPRSAVSDLKEHRNFLATLVKDKKINSNELLIDSYTLFDDIEELLIDLI